MFTHNIDPILFSYGPFEVRYYGLFYVIAFVIGYFLINKLAKERSIPLTKDDVSSFLFYEIIAMLIGARVFYVLFYNVSYYLNKPVEILYIWNGGLSFHGGLVGFIICGYFFAKKKGIPFGQLADIAVIPAAIGLGLGRIGNFTNGELYGRITDVSWAVQFSGVDGLRHPSQLYEAAKNFFIFGVLWQLRNKKHRNGYLFWVFIALYGVLRFFIEFVRQPDTQLGFVMWQLTMGQLLVIPMGVIGLLMVYRLRRKELLMRD